MCVCLSAVDIISTPHALHTHKLQTTCMYTYLQHGRQMDCISAMRDHVCIMLVCVCMYVAPLTEPLG